MPGDKGRLYFGSEVCDKSYETMSGTETKVCLTPYYAPPLPPPYSHTNKHSEIVECITLQEYRLKMSIIINVSRPNIKFSRQVLFFQ